MKLGEINIDTQELVNGITSEVLKTLKPLLVSKQITEQLYTVETLAEYLSVSKQWVYERVKLKEIPHIKVGKFPRFKKNDINKWLEGQKIMSTGKN